MIKLSKLFKKTTENCLLIIVSVLCIMSCKEKEPVPLIEEELMVRLLADLHISEAATQNVDVTLRDSFRQVYYEQIFKIHEIDQAIFEQEITLLKTNPKRLSIYYDQVIKILEKDKQQKERKKPDKNPY